MVTAQLRQTLLAIEVPKAGEFNEDEWERNIFRVYGTEQNSVTARAIIALQKKLGWIYEDKLPTYRAKWGEIREVLSNSPTPEQMLRMLESIGLSLAQFEAMYTKEKITDAIRYAKDLKDRYTVLWMHEQVK